MLSQHIEAGLMTVSAAAVTDVILVALVLIFLLSYYFKRNHKHQMFTGYTPTLLTSLGILGTFVGIVIGLLGFDATDIDSSIAPLLEGLKTAFTSSLAGMLLSIIYKGLVTFGVLIPATTEVVDDDDVGSADFYNLMKTQIEGVEQLKRAIAGDDESSLVGVLKLHRADSMDHYRVIQKSIGELADRAERQEQAFAEFQTTLWQHFKEFSEMLSKSATEQVIEALNQVIKDFNDKLTEQFGENFKKLNEAVEKLVIWQDNYKDQLNDMGEKYALGVAAIGKTQESVTAISEEAKAIPTSMADLNKVMEVNQHQIQELDRHLEAFKDVRDKAVDAVPEIRSQIDMAIKGAQEANTVLAEGMNESAKNMHKILSDGSEDFKNNVSQANAALTEASQTTANSSEEIKNQLSSAIEEINNHMRNMLSEIQEGGRELNTSYKEAGEALISETGRWNSEFSKAIEDTRENLAATISEQAQSHRDQADRVFRSLEKSIEDALSSTGESVKKQVDMIDKSAEAEITKVMESMGKALGSISGQFTHDYQELVGAMKKVVDQR